MENELEQILQRNDSFHHLTVKIDTCLFSQQTENSFGALSINSSKEPSGVKIKLPTLKITTFSGDITTWQSFWDQYNSAIHSNKEISDINKFNYLHSFLCEEARSIISGLAPTSSNYTTAVGLLQKRYGNTQVLISSVMNKFVTLQKVNNDKDVRGLRRLLDQTETSMRNLQSLNVETDRYGTLLVPLINDKLPDNLRISIAKNFEDDIWDIETLVKFLREEVEAKERSFAVGASFGDNPEHDFYNRDFS